MDNQNKIIKILSFISVICIIFSLCVECFCASAVSYSTYSDTLTTNSTVQGLLSLRTLSNSSKHYISFRSSQNKYILIVGSDIKQTGNNTVSFNDCLLYEYDSSITGNTTKYHLYPTQSGTISVNHIVVSDIIDFSSKADNSPVWLNFIYILAVLIVFLLIFNIIRRFK